MGFGLFRQLLRLTSGIRSQMKIILQIIGSLLLLFAIVAGFSSAKEWLILKHLPGYEKDHFTITGTRAIHRTGEDGTDYYLQGQGERGAYEFVIPAARYENFSSPTATGTKIILYTNPAMPSITFQKESVNVIFEDDWRDKEEVQRSAKSTLWISVISLLVGVAAFVGARSLRRSSN